MDESVAIELAAGLLRDLPNRHAHSVAVGQRAGVVVDAIPSIRASVVVAAAYLHDVGYSHALRDTGCHGLDGARWLADLGEPELAALVAHHTAAPAEAHLRGLTANLLEYGMPVRPEVDVLTYCDLTVGPHGEALTFDDRLQDIRWRYPPGSAVRRAVEATLPQLRQSVRRVERLLAEAIAS